MLREEIGAIAAELKQRSARDELDRQLENVLAEVEPEREKEQSDFLYDALGLQNLAAPQSQPESEEDSPAERRIYELECQLFGCITGKATLDGRFPVLRGEVTVSKDGVPVQKTWTHGEETDPTKKEQEGHFEVGNLRADEYKLMIEIAIEDRTYSRTWSGIRVQAGEPTNLGTRRLCGTIKGRACLRDDVPAPHAEVFVYHTGTTMAEESAITEETKPDGSFTVRLPREGTYDVTILSQYHTHGKTIQNNKVGPEQDKSLGKQVLIPLDRPTE